MLRAVLSVTVMALGLAMAGCPTTETKPEPAKLDTKAAAKCPGCGAIKDCSACKVALKDGKCPGCGKTPVCEKCAAATPAPAPAPAPAPPPPAM